jgi:hypothetical protein
MLTDPSGQHPLLYAILAGFAGLGASIAVGAAAGATLGYLMYPAALARECGCEMLQQAIASGGRWQFSAGTALSGGLMGGYSYALVTAGIAVGPVGLLIVSGIGLAVFGADFYHTYNIIKHETGRLTWCTATRLVLDVVGIVFSGMGAWKAAAAWRASGSGFSWVVSPGLIASTRNDLEAAASRARTQAGPGSGHEYGSRVHKIFAEIVEAMGRTDLEPEVSYLNHRRVNTGTPGSIRADVVLGSPDNPIAIFDLKTGSATLTSARILEIRSQLPISSQNIPIIQIGPP